MIRILMYIVYSTIKRMFIMYIYMLVDLKNVKKAKNQK